MHAWCMPMPKRESSSSSLHTAFAAHVRRNSMPSHLCNILSEHCMVCI